MQTIAKAIRELKRSSHSKSNDDAVTRANDRADAAMEMPISTMAEAEAKLRLILASEQEDLHEIQVIALKTIAGVLAAAVKGSAH